LGPIPNPQSPIPNPQSPISKTLILIQMINYYCTKNYYLIDNIKIYIMN